MNASGLGAVVVAGWLSLGCAVAAAKTAFGKDFDCRKSTVEATTERGRFRVQGCERTAYYLCTEEGVCTRSEATAAERRSRLASSVGMESNAGSLMQLEVALESQTRLRFTAAPEKEPNVVQLKLLRKAAGAAKECSLDFMVNGQRLLTPPTVSSQKDDELSHRVQIGSSLIEDFGDATKIALRACEQRWTLTGPQVQDVREFIEQFREEVAWKAPPRAAGLAGMAAPSGGWPDWKPSATPAPAAVTGDPMDGSALFKKLSPSVFVLEALRADETAQGSAVAVSTSELVTNCHVVQGARKLTLKQGQRSWPARLVRADPKTDRCTLSAEGAELSPVAGVRSYASLEIGELAYTLGSPVGLELTLSNGIVSGRREEEGRSFVQTTAPISPGSSGGGLFDSRGNLIGITTLVLAGKERLNQSLNFAIPAEFYFDSAAGKAQL